jgi:hypothetical protein
MEIFAKQCLLDFVWLALPFAGVVAFRRFRLSAAEFAANRRFKVQKRSQLFIGMHMKRSVIAMCVLQSRLFARWNSRLRRSPNSNRLC